MSDKNFAKIFGRDATEESGSVQVDEKPTQKNDDEAVEAYEGQLAIDVYQTEDEIIVKTPIAGVRAEDLDISVTDDVMTVKGERKQDEKIEESNYLVQECYWGSFSRSSIGKKGRKSKIKSFPENSATLFFKLAKSLLSFTITLVCENLLTPIDLTSINGTYTIGVPSSGMTPTMV